MESLNPLPHTFREAVWQAVVAILLATRIKDIWGVCHRTWIVLRESGAVAKIRAAEAHKTDAEAEAIEAGTMISLFREMRISMKQAEKIRETLSAELISKDSIIALLKAENEQLKSAQPESKDKTGA